MSVRAVSLGFLWSFELGIWSPPEGLYSGLEFFWDLELGFWDFSEAWSLGFGSSPRRFMERESLVSLRACIATMNRPCLLPLLQGEGQGEEAVRIWSPHPRGL